jgi:hypothetical protein
VCAAVAGHGASASAHHVPVLVTSVLVTSLAVSSPAPGAGRVPCRPSCTLCLSRQVRAAGVCRPSSPPPLSGRPSSTTLPFLASRSLSGRRRSSEAGVVLQRLLIQHVLQQLCRPEQATRCFRSILLWGASSILRAASSRHYFAVCVLIMCVYIYGRF